MNRISESLGVLLWTCVFIYVVSSSFQITQVDIWWQIPEGFRILHTFHLPTQPVAAYGLPAHPYFDEYAGYEVVLACIYQLTGFVGIWILSISAYLMIMFLPSLFARKDSFRFDILSCLALLFASVLMKERLDQRPELVGTVLQVGLMVWLRGSKLEQITRGRLLLLFAIFVAWANVHSSFTIGMFTLALWAACEFTLKFRNFPVRLLIRNGFLFGAVALVASLFNPYGIKRLWFPFAQVFDPGATVLSPEMWPISDALSVSGILVLIAATFLAWIFLTSKKRSLWLVVFSLVSVYMTTRSFRCISLLAIAMLFACAERDAASEPVLSRSPLVILPKIAVLSFLIIAIAFGAAFNLVFTWDEMKNERHFAQRTSLFASELIDPDVSPSKEERPVLCTQSVGSYLSFTRNFRPLIDSGMAHFSSDFKRYFFLTWHDPRAFKRALDSLTVDYVIIDKYTFPWILGLESSPGWKMVACSPNGMIWQRFPGGVYVPSPTDRLRIGELRDRFLAQGNAISAFCCSTLVDPPEVSLSILEKNSGQEWPDTVFNYFIAWLGTLPRATIESYVVSGNAQSNVPMTAILCQYLGPDQYAQFVKTVPATPVRRPWYWTVLQVRYEMSQGHMDEAQKIFGTMRVNTTSSETYYSLWQEMKSAAPQMTARAPGAYGQWQMWDENADKFMQSVSEQLNQRIIALDKAGVSY